MSVNLGLLIVAGVLGATGVYLLMERSLVRMLLGLLLVGNGINILIVTLSGSPGNPPIRGAESVGATADADPLAQAMVLTAIVITMGVAAFVLAMTYRLFIINRQDDDLEDDAEDAKLLKGSLKDFPDRDRSDDPETGADTVAGDLFDAHGNPLTPEEFAAAHRGVIETDLMPEDAAVIVRLPEFSTDEMPDDYDEDEDQDSDGDDDTVDLEPSIPDEDGDYIDEPPGQTDHLQDDPHDTAPDSEDLSTDDSSDGDPSPDDTPDADPSADGRGETP